MSLGSLSATLTRRSRSNFYYAFLTLPRARREALYAVYAFCRTVDDVADLGTDRAVQRAGLARWREDVARCFQPGPPPEHPIARQLAAAVRDFHLPRAALEAVVEGCEMDLTRTTYETAAELAGDRMLGRAPVVAPRDVGAPARQAGALGLGVGAEIGGVVHGAAEGVDRVERVAPMLRQREKGEEEVGPAPARDPGAEAGEAHVVTA